MTRDEHEQEARAVAELVRIEIRRNFQVRRPHYTPPPWEAPGGSAWLEEIVDPNRSSSVDAPRVRVDAELAEIKEREQDSAALPEKTDTKKGGVRK